MDLRTNQLARALSRLGMSQGDHVAVFGWNRAEILEAEVALYKGGFVKVPINVRLSNEEMVHVANDGQAKVIIVDPSHLGAVVEVREKFESVEHIICMGKSADWPLRYEALLEENSSDPVSAPVKENDIAVLHYTSGSSGVLKAAIQTVGNRLCNLRKYLLRPGGLAKPGEIIAHVGPITHASGMMIMPTLYSGACNLLLPRFEPEFFLSMVEKERINQVFMVPTMINMILNSPALDRYDLSSLKRLGYGVAPMSPSRIRQAIERLGPILSQGYGAGETTGLVTVLSEEDHVRGLKDKPELLASCGRCYFDTNVMVLDEGGMPVAPGVAGEIAVQGPDVMAGYWNAPELTAPVLKEGRYFTGDVATVDEEGFISIIDRKKEMIISGGFNVYPNEVEKILYTHPDVFEACVFGIPDDTWGEAIKAVVVLKDGAKASASSIIDHCTNDLAGFKRPKSVEFADDLPKNPNGKIMRKTVRETHWKNQERRVN